MMRCTVTFSPSLKNAPNGQGHRVTGELDETTGILWVKCHVTAHAPAGRFGVCLASRAIIAPAVVEAKKAA